MSVDISVFKTAIPYRSFKERDWTILAERLQVVNIPCDQAVFKEGDEGNGFFLLRSGKIKIRRMVDPEEKGRHQEQLLTILSAGQLFGEMVLAGDASRSADAVAVEDAVLYHLSQADYENLKTREPGTALRIQDIVVNTLCSRLREANRSYEIIQFWLT